MPQGRCPMCLKIREYDLQNNKYLRFQNTERLVCKVCSGEVEQQLRPTWQIVGNRIFPRSILNV